MSGKKNKSLKKIYNMQADYQKKILVIKGESAALPVDNMKWFSYHIQAMVEEMGEVMKADKRWKTHRNKSFSPEEKIDELADVFITAMNLSIYSGIDGEELAQAIENKINKNTEALKTER